MPKFKIIWTSYETPFPAIVTEKTFLRLKSSNDKSIYSTRFSYFKEFAISISTVLIGIAFLIIDAFNPGGMNDFMGIFVLVAGYTFIYLILSSISYIDNYRDSKRYLKNLEMSVMESESYKDFCINMSKIDRRYIMHMQRISNTEQ